MVADRRLSRKGRPPKDDARKIVLLETTDGNAIIGYAGLGATARGTEPSDWMGRVLRGRNWPMEQALIALAAAMQDHLPKHLRQTAVRDIAAHSAIIPAFVGGKPGLYVIDMLVSGSGKTLGFNTQRLNGRSGIEWPPRIAVTGSGGMRLPPQNRWLRQLLRLLNAHDKGRIRAEVVADALARLSFEVHKRDSYTGPNCIVAWRHCRKGRHKGGGAHAYYEGTTRIVGGAPIPSIGRGRDMGAFINAILPFIVPQLEAIMDGKSDPGLDVSAMKAATNRLPTDPDENLD
jgi:hypothetical protein